jgi:hypothetical protein
MDEFIIKAIEAAVKPPWSYFVGAAVLILLNLNSLIELRERWRSSYTETRRLEQEKLRLEVEKLRRELQISERPVYVPDVVPDIAREFGPIRIDPRPSAVTDVIEAPVAPQRPGIVRRFVLEHPGPGHVLMWAAQIVLVPTIAMFGFATPGIVLAGWNDPELGPMVSMVVSLVYAGLTALAYWGFRSAGSIRKAAAGGSQDPPLRTLR